jgi:hypothetical protein
MPALLASGVLISWPQRLAAQLNWRACFFPGPRSPPCCFPRMIFRFSFIRCVRCCFFSKVNALCTRSPVVKTPCRVSQPAVQPKWPSPAAKAAIRSPAQPRRPTDNPGVTSHLLVANAYKYLSSLENRNEMVGLEEGPTSAIEKSHQPVGQEDD